MAKKFDPYFEDQAKALTVQKHQLRLGQEHVNKIKHELDKLKLDTDHCLNELDDLIQFVENKEENCLLFVDEEDGGFFIEVDELNQYQSDYVQLGKLDIISSDHDWEAYLHNVNHYAQKHQIQFTPNRFNDLLSVNEHIQFEKWIRDEFTIKGANCDKYDYMIAGSCGLIGGVIDVFLVGAPGQGFLTKFTDNIANESVKKFAKLVKNSDLKPMSNLGKSVSSYDLDDQQQAIQYLENFFKVNYDHTGKKIYDQTTGELLNQGEFSKLLDGHVMNPNNHHIRSLGHSPDIFGLFFSILDQFTDKASFFANGKIVSIDTTRYTSTKEVFHLRGETVSEKIFFGFVNWLGHLMSDLAGSNSAKGRGAGIPIPFYSLLQFLDFGEFGPDRQTFATMAVRVYQEGYDFRHGMALAIPVLITELLTRLMWVVKKRFYHKADWKDCVPSINQPELRRMLLVAHGTLCLTDLADATLRTTLSGGNMITFLMHTNFIAWIRLGTVALKEIPSWFREGGLDAAAMEQYLNKEYKRLLSTV